MYFWLQNGVLESYVQVQVKLLGVSGKGLKHWPCFQGLCTFLLYRIHSLEFLLIRSDPVTWPNLQWWTTKLQHNVVEFESKSS